MSVKGEGRSQVYAEIVRDGVQVHSEVDPSSNYRVTFDLNEVISTGFLLQYARYCIKQIAKDDIHIFERMDMEISQLPDYPPRLLIFVKQLTGLEAYDAVPEIHASGLNKPVSFKLPLTGEEN